MAPEEYDELFEIQDGVCAICKKPDRSRRLSVDHCHETDKVRGLLCRECNAGLGYFQDDSETLRGAADYLEKGLT